MGNGNMFLGGAVGKYINLSKLHQNCVIFLYRIAYHISPFQGVPFLKPYCIYFVIFYVFLAISCAPILSSLQYNTNKINLDK